MGKLIERTVVKTAGTQFAGTEFSVTPLTQGAVLKLRELNLQMGTESKTFRVEKRDAQGNKIALIQQSVDGTGAPAPSTAESVVITGGEFEVLLTPGEQIQIVTTGATAGMRATAYYEEVFFTPTSVSPFSSVGRSR